jgi:hypothetical protein
MLMWKTMIYSLTAVPAERQKLIGLTKGKLPTTSDADRFGTLGIPYRPDGRAIKFTMVGTPEKDTFIDPTEQGTAEVSHSLLFGKGLLLIMLGV